MIGKLIASFAVGGLLSLSATADTTGVAKMDGEALAWTVAAYADCESIDRIQADFKTESTKMQASMTDVVAALNLLAEADNVCGHMNLFAADMLALVETDMAMLEAKLGASKPAATPVRFEPEEPKGPGAPNSIILSNSTDLPPLSGTGTNPQSSDYQE